MKKLLAAIVLFSSLAVNGQYISDIGFSAGMSNLQTDFGTSETINSSIANFGSYISLDYKYNLFETIGNLNDPMYKYFWGHMVLKANVSYSYVKLEYEHLDDGDPIFTGELPGTELLSGYSDVVTAGAAFEYHFLNLMRFYARRSSIKFSPYIGFGFSYAGASVNTNSKSNYEGYYANYDPNIVVDGEITDNEIPLTYENGTYNIITQEGDLYPLRYGVNPIAEDNLSNFSNVLYQLYPDSDIPNMSDEEKAYRAQLFRYAGMNRPNWVNTVGFNFNGGIRTTLTNRLDLNFEGSLLLFLSDDLDGLNMPWSQNQAKESMVNITAGIYYKL